MRRLCQTAEGMQAGEVQGRPVLTLLHIDTSSQVQVLTQCISVPVLLGNPLPAGRDIGGNAGRAEVHM